MIRFRFNLPKTIQTICYILSRCGQMDKLKLVKLIYLADRAHFIRHGMPITGDRQVAMPYGPVPSSTLDAINGNRPDANDQVYPFIHLSDTLVSRRKAPGFDLLSAEEIQTLDVVLAKYGEKDTWSLAQETHQLPEYHATYIQGTSTPIPYERIAEFSGSESRFRNGRLVMIEAMTQHIECPFPDDSDL